MSKEFYCWHHEATGDDSCKQQCEACSGATGSEEISNSDSQSAAPTVVNPSGLQDEKFMPPDNGDICWQMGAETFTRKEVAYLLYTQRAMISNDLKFYCGDKMTSEMFKILDNPRKPEY